eukprot:m.136869 g.136869  ORF g.136869 m.136869 type:complete len:500 (+) comp9912_c0_seq1:3655-5154(+)
MGCALSTQASDAAERGAPSNQDVTQLAEMSAHLCSLPAKAEARGKCGKIRLINKARLLQHPLVHSTVQEVMVLVQMLQAGAFTHGSGMGSSEMYDQVKFEPVGSVGLSLSAIGDELNKLSARMRRQRPALEELLFWHNHKSDEFCQLFALDRCPKFTFISHRWAPRGAALGVANELLLVLSMAPEDYIWLDCTCAPQDKASFDNGNCLKIIWNIDHLLDRAQSMLCYYATDGLWLKDEFTFSDGLYRLFELESKGKRQFAQQEADVFFREGEKRSTHGSLRLWCVFERLFGDTKVQTIKIPEDAASQQRMPLALLSFHVMNRLQSEAGHARHELSLDCFSTDDIEPLTMIMYRNGKLPCYFSKDLLPLCIDSSSNDAVHGLLLPDPSFLPKRGVLGEIADHEYSKLHNGWYTVQGQEGAFLQILPPSKSKHSSASITLHIHYKCLVAACERGESIWRYDPRHVLSKRNPLCINEERWGKHRIHKTTCVFGDRCTEVPSD